MVQFKGAVSLLIVKKGRTFTQAVSQAQTVMITGDEFTWEEAKSWDVSAQALPTHMPEPQVRFVFERPIHREVVGSVPVHYFPHAFGVPVPREVK
jgi:hypothetical protein